MLKGARFWTLLVVMAITATAQRAQGACCLASCIGPVPWVACFADTTSCNMLQCAGGSSTSLHVDPAGICGQGLFGGCPPTEVGACNDMINNDGWVDSVTDAADPDCQAQTPAPTAAVPAVGAPAIAVIIGILIVVAALRIRRGRPG